MRFLGFTSTNVAHSLPTNQFKSYQEHQFLDNVIVLAFQIQNREELRRELQKMRLSLPLSYANTVLTL